MKVLVCIPCLMTGGTEIQTLNLVNALIQGGHTVKTVCYFEHSDDKFIEALGGTDNIISYDLRGQARLSVVLKDKEKINKEELKKFYVDRFLEMSDKIILVGENLEPLAKILDKFKSN